MISAERLSRLVDDIYATTTDSARWPRVLEEIADVLSSGTATLLVHDLEHATFPLVLTTKNFSDEVVVAYRDHFGAIDVLRDRSMQLGDGELGTEHELAPHSGLRDCEVYWDLYVRNGMGHILGGYVAKDDGFGAVVALHRPIEMREYDADDIRTSQLIVPHLARAIRLQRRLSFSAGVSAAGMDALDRASLATFIVDINGRVIAHNARAEALLATGDLQLRTLTQLRMPAYGDVIRVGRFIVVVTPAPRELGGAAVVFVIDPDAMPPRSEEQLRRAYGFSPAEARVAMQLCRGKSPEAIADESGVTRETVRTHVKRLLAKTGTRRQSDFVSLLLRGVLRVDAG